MPSKSKQILHIYLSLFQTQEISLLLYIWLYFVVYLVYLSSSGCCLFIVICMVVHHLTFIKQKGECIIRYFGRPCDEFAERVWPIKISDGARITLFNKGLVACDVNQFF